MKSTDRQLFLRHQRRCVKCRQLKAVRIRQLGDHDVVVLLEIHDKLMRLLYHQSAGENDPERLSDGLPAG